MLTARHNETIGIMNRISKTPCLMISVGLGSLPHFSDEETEARDAPRPHREAVCLCPYQKSVFCSSTLLWPSSMPTALTPAPAPSAPHPGPSSKGSNSRAVSCCREQRKAKKLRAAIPTSGAGPPNFFASSPGRVPWNGVPGTNFIKFSTSSQAEPIFPHNAINGTNIYKI